MCIYIYYGKPPLVQGALRATFQDSGQYVRAWGNMSGLGATCQDSGQHVRTWDNMSDHIRSRLKSNYNISPTRIRCTWSHLHKSTDLVE